MISFSEAQQLIIKAAVPAATEPVSLQAALNRVLAVDLVADRDYPPFNRAAMDGYALRIAEIKAGITVFTVTETIFAGAVPLADAPAGAAYRIMTGAAVPPGMDVVVRVEDTSELEGRVEIKSIPSKPFQNIAKKGEDTSAGQTVIKAPLLCKAAAIGTMAALGIHEPVVYRQPRIALITTGNEVVSVDELPSTVQIRNSNMQLLKALLSEMNMQVSAEMHVPDDPELMEAAVKAGLSYDILITCGGVSAGDADHIPEIMQQLQVNCLFHKVAIKPGKPVWCGTYGNNTRVFALPGNPFSCYVCFKLFVETYIRACVGLAPVPFRSTSFVGERTKKSSLDEFFPVEWMEDSLAVRAVPYRGSGDVIASLQTAALAWHPAATEKLQDGFVKVLPA